MFHFRKLAACMLSGILLLASAPALPASSADISSLTYAGVDISTVISLENSGVIFRDKNGNPADIFFTLADAGVNTIRVRVWNNPYTANGQSYGGGICDVDCAVQIAKRCKAAGLKMLVDFHYSDFWADPGKQAAPKAWKNYNIQQKADAIYQFTADTLKKISATGADIAMVQVGNETTSGMCGVLLDDYDWNDTGWQNLAALYNAGAKAVRDFNRNCKVVLHFTNPERSGHYPYLAKMLKQCNVDYDVFASSYYPYWHGTLQNLTSVLSSVASTYGKEVMVAETSWVYSMEDTDCYRNTVPYVTGLGDYVSYPVSVAGQTQFLTDLFSAVANTKNGIGVFYWEPAWLTVGNNYASNLALWEQYGSGWATKASMEYDPDGKDYGGSSVDNQALFAADGTPLDSLYVFRKITGNGGNDNPPTTQEGTNLLQNPSFEANGGWTNSPTGWSISALSSGHFDVREEDPLAGSCALHWYSESGFTNCTATTTVKATEDGIYRFSICTQGDTSSSIRMEAKAGGSSDVWSGNETGWSQWQTPTITLPAKAGDNLTLTLTVSGSAGCYGSVDCCEIVRISGLPVQTTTVTTTLATTTTSTTTTTTTTAPPTEILMGDADNNGKISIADVVLLSRYVNEDQAVSLTPAGRANADCNGDTMLTYDDCTLILKMIARLI